MKTMTSRDANQDFSRAKRESETAPVLITDRAKPTRVLLAYDEYRRLTEKPKSLFDLPAMPGQDEVEFEPPKRMKDQPREVDFSRAICSAPMSCRRFGSRIGRRRAR